MPRHAQGNPVAEGRGQAVTTSGLFVVIEVHRRGVQGLVLPWWDCSAVRGRVARPWQGCGA